MIDFPQAAAMTRTFIEKLIKQSEVIDKKFIDRIKKIPVKRVFVPRSTKSARVILTNPQPWILGVQSLDEDAYKTEQKLSLKGETIAKGRLSKPTSDVSWIRYGPSFKFPRKIREGDVVFEIQSGKAAKAHGRVYPARPILHKMVTKDWIRLYLEDAADIEDRAISVTAFRRLVIRAGYTGKIGKRMGRRITDQVADALSALWPK